MKLKMIASAFSILAIGLMSSPAYGQDSKSFYKTSYNSRNSGSYHKGQNTVTVGYGFAGRYHRGYVVPNSSSRRGFGPVYLKYERGIRDEIGVGGFVALAGGRYEYGPNRIYEDKFGSTAIGVQAFYHFNKLIPVRALDVYAGVGGGLRFNRYDYDDNFSNRSSDADVDPIPFGVVGARYWFTDGFGVYAEAGYDGMSSVNTGITFRF